MKSIVVSACLLFTLGSFWYSVSLAGTVTDIDGNVYQTVTIGGQEWMAENLKVTRYRNGDTIPNVTDSVTWEGLNSGAYGEYDNDSSNVATYGRLYNWFAVNDSRNIAPAGWHVPTDAEWKQLEMCLGMSQAEADKTGLRGNDEGGKLKEAGTTHWNTPNTGATNESSFSVLPGSLRTIYGNFGTIGFYAFFWSSTEYDIGGAWYRSLGFSYSAVYRLYFDKRDGFSVRCVNDIPVGIDEHGGAEHPNAFRLAQNYPNPFNPVTIIEYSIPTRSSVTIEIFNVLGQKVRTLVNESKSVGSYRIEWNGSDETGKSVSTGVYLYRFQAGDIVQTKKILLIK
ncbi:MAG: T9SS type A sorting domain-containing protein [candidate division Zixibacteria bacterium]|nr:T9SS type A sorting domain-containing protein [candidate division Zixibacteria bacterium]